VLRGYNRRMRNTVLIIALVLTGIGNAAAADAPATGHPPDIIRIVSGSRTLTLDPTRSWNSGDIETFGQLYSRLLRRDRAGDLQPGIAERWDISADAKTYTFYLREARFSNGEPITADDVRFSLLRMRDDPEALYSEPVSGVIDVSVVDPRTIRVTLAEPNIPFLDALEVCFLGITSRADIESRGAEKAFTDMPVTSGPYRVREWKPGDRLVLEANPYYWRDGFPRNDGAELIEVMDANTRIAMLLAGEADAVRQLGWSKAASFRANGKVSVPHEPANYMWLILLNHAQPPFNDLRVRQAAALALDRDAMARVVLRNLGPVANTTMPASLDYHLADFPGWAYDPERARQLMAEANAAGQEVVINIAAPSPQMELIGLILQAQWAEIGLETRIVKMDQGQEVQRLMDGDYDASINWWYNENPDPDLALKWAVCGSCGNRAYYTNYQNAEVDRLIAEAARETDLSRRGELYQRVQRISTEEVAQIPLFYPPWVNAYSLAIEGLGMTPALQWTLEHARHLR
jgi:peptide/nickel transport system substrate-binding protein